MNARTENVRLKVQRADEHIADLEAEIQGFIATNPYQVSTNRDPDTRQLIYYLNSCADMPAQFSLIVGDALQNLRSALDHLVWQLVEAAGNIPTSGNAFPITKNLAAYQSSNTAAKVKGITTLAKNAIDAIKPYRGGNDALWKLHRLNNVDKHRLLITVGGAVRHIDVGAILQKGMVDGLKGTPLEEKSQVIAGLNFHFPVSPADRLFPLEQGVELFRDMPDAEHNEDIKFAFDVAFGEPGVAEGEPLLETLKEISDVVNTLISDFDSLLV